LERLTTKNEIGSIRNLKGCTSDADPEIFRLVGGVIKESIDSGDSDRLNLCIEFLYKLHDLYLRDSKYNSGTIRVPVIDLINTELRESLRPYRVGSVSGSGPQSFDRALGELGRVADSLSMADTSREAAAGSEETHLNIDSRIEEVVDSRLEKLGNAAEALGAPPRGVVDESARDDLARVTSIFLVVAIIALSYLAYCKYRSLIDERIEPLEMENRSDAHEISQLKKLTGSLTKASIVQILDESLDERTQGRVSHFGEFVKGVLRMGAEIVAFEKKMGSLTSTQGSRYPEGEAQMSPDRDSVEVSGGPGALASLNEKVKDLEALGDRVGSLEKEVARQADRREKPGREAEKWERPSTAIQVRDLELEILGTAWHRYLDLNREIVTSLAAATKEWGEIRDDLLMALQRAIKGHPSLRPSYESALTAARDFDYVSSRLSLIGRLVAGDLPQIEDTAKELMRIREYAGLLSVLQSSERGTERLRFDARSWIRAQFRSFADLFFRTYQELESAGMSSDLGEAQQIVTRVLGWAGVEVVAIRLGRTAFNSREHIGRSTVNRPDFPDGVIVSVIKSGFREVGGSVVQQPEVVVNRR